MISEGKKRRVSVGVEGPDVVVFSSQDGQIVSKDTWTPAAAREFARLLITMADLLEPEVAARETGRGG